MITINKWQYRKREMLSYTEYICIIGENLDGAKFFINIVFSYLQSCEQNFLAHKTKRGWKSLYTVNPEVGVRT